MFEANLASQVTSYGPENPDWGGPACVQMAMNGYPAGATSCFINQTTIWNYIQANNKEGGVGSWGIGWYADPYAVTKTLNDLCPPQHSWIDVSGTNKDTVLYTLFRWMANYQYASLVCVFAHDYWSTLVYYRTSDDPRVVTSPTLERIGWYEPYYSSWSGGPQVDYKEVDGSVWMTSPYYWGAPCGGFGSLCGQMWNGKYVGIGEPPDVEGSVEVAEVPRTGTKLIDPGDAVAAAREFLANRRQERPDFLRGRLSGLQDVRPILVRELPPEPELRASERDVRYYVVPFSNRFEVDRAGVPLARLSVLVNAYTGRFEELCVFPQPVRYLAEENVVESLGRRLGLNRNELLNARTEFVYRPLRPYVSSALPALQLESADYAFFVTQDDLVLASLSIPRLRGA